LQQHGGIEATPLSAQDEAILRLENGVLAGHTCKVIGLGAGSPSLEQLRERVAARVAAVPVLAQRLERRRGGDCWVSVPGFDPGAHVQGAAGPCDAPALRREVARLFSERLDRSRPLWQMDLLPQQDGSAALVWRLHHTLADGTTAMRFAQALLWDEPPAGGRPPRPGAQAGDERRRRLHMARFFAREFARASSPFDGPIGTRREVAFARLPLAPLHAAAKQLAGATLNDALLTAVGGGLRSWLERRHGELRRGVRVKVPVSLHRQGDHAGNADSFFMVEVPLAEADPVRRLRAVHEGTAARKSEHDAETMDRLLSELRGASPRLGRLCERVERSGRAFALNVSNVPGPRAPVAICGAPVGSIHSLAEIARHHAVRVAAVSLCDELFLGFLSDPAIVPDLAWMAQATESDGAALVAAAG
jgi:hypothetical protein